MTAPAVNAPSRTGGAPSRWDQRWFRAFGSDAHVVVGDAGDLGSWVIDEAERIERCWSRFRPDSELVRLNRCRQRIVRVSPLMIDIAERAGEAWELTGGLFDPTILGALERAGYRGSFETHETWTTAPEAASSEAPERHDAVPGFGAVIIDRATSSITREPGTRLDWGGIGKGLAADLLATGLVERGAGCAVVGLGGDVRVAGDAPGTGWPIPVEVPGSPGSLWFTRPLATGAIVTSSTRDRRWTAPDGSPRHHLIDPRTASPSRSGVSAVVVVAAEAWRAEVLAKAALIAGPCRGMEMLVASGVTAWMLDDDGAVIAPNAPVDPALDPVDRPPRLADSPAAA